MQTFLPYCDFKECAKCLDNLRLNKQILEARTIYDIIVENRTEGAWANHPIVKMWRNYPEALMLYYNSCLYEWKYVRRRNHSYEMLPFNMSAHIGMPKWIGDERLHSSHRANLLRKDYEFYSKYGWDENHIEYWKMPYWWGEEYGYGNIPETKKKKSRKAIKTVIKANDTIIKKWTPKKWIITKKLKE